jgi:valyl-tRNA synthetase
MLEEQRSLFSFLAKVDDANLVLTRTLDEKPRKAVALVAAEGVEAYLPLAGLVDLDQEVARLRKGLAQADREIQGAEAKLANQGFVTKAPAHVVQRVRDRLAEEEERRARLEARLEALSD